MMRAKSTLVLSLASLLLGALLALAARPAAPRPEAVVLAPDGRTILYWGRLDDQYAALGERRTVSQHHELAGALADPGRPVAVPRPWAATASWAR